MKTTLALFALASISLHAQSTISATDRYAYSANAGWIDFRADASNGTRVLDTCLTGFAYAANFGWIHLGDGSPSNGHTYSNSSASDFGVNVSPDGLLTGSAYAANIGWITFEPTHGQPELNLITGKITGHAYAANLGWIALDTPSSDLATLRIARPDTDGDGLPDAWEKLRFSDLTTANATTDNDGDSASDAAEYIADTNPTDPNSRLRIIAHSYPSASQANLTWTSRPTRIYRIEHDTDLVNPWVDSVFGTLNPSSGTTTSGNLTGLTPSPRRFLRAVALLPLP
jgi:Bacterial TSP3 repeat